MLKSVEKFSVVELLLIEIQKALVVLFFLNWKAKVDTIFVLFVGRGLDVDITRKAEISEEREDGVGL